MKYVNLGRSGLKISELCLGTMQWGWTADEKTACAVMDAFIDAGGNFLDTADIYSSWVDDNPGGVSEQIIGRWMKARNNRRDIVLATKVRGKMWEGPNGEGLSRAHIMQAAEDSLRRLGTEVIDLYQVHWDDLETPMDETLRALDDLVRQGKVRYLGCSNIAAWRLTKALWTSDRLGLARYDSLQPNFSLVRRAEFEAELMPLCESEGIGVIPYSPLAGGFLTGKYQPDVDKPDSARLDAVRRYFNPRDWGILETVERVAAEHAATAAQIALAWQLAQAVISSPIIGANSVAQLQESVKATGVALSADDMKALDEGSAWKEALGN